MSQEMRDSRMGGLAPPPIPPPALSYASRDSAERGRGMLTAVGIVSVIVALISLAASGATTYLLARGTWQSIPPRAPGAPPPLAPATVQPYTGESMRPHGLARDARRSLIAALPISGPFKDDRREMMERLLAEAGQTIFAGATPDAAKLSRHPPAPGADAWAAEQFDTPGGGAIVLDNRTATFYPTAGAQAGAVKVDMDHVIDGATNRWSCVAVDQRLAELRKQLPRITDLQAAQVVQLLDQHVPAPLIRYKDQFAPPDTVALNYCRIDDGAVLVANINGTYWLVLPDGRYIDSGLALYGIDLARGAPRPGPQKPFVPLMPGSPAAMGALTLQAAASVAVAILLMIAGIRALAHSPVAASAHLRWVGLKGLLLAAEIALSVWYFTTVPAARAAGRLAAVAPRPVSRMSYSLSRGHTALISGAVMQSIYPLILLAVFLGMARREARSRRAALATSESSNGKTLRAVIRAVVLGAFVLGALHLGTGMALGRGMLADIANVCTHVLVGGGLLVLGMIVWRKLGENRDRDEVAR